MWTDGSRWSSRMAVAAQCARELRSDERGTVAILMGVLLPVLVGAMGLALEISYWYMTNRSMQNAADAAAIAAAINAGSNYNVEAKAVAALYGFTDGSKNVTVTVSNTAACPSGGNTCYSVTITGLVPLFLSEVVGFTGTSKINGVPQRSLSATAVAKQASLSVPLCMLALGTSGAQDIVTNGNPNANMADCSVMANTSETCNGHNLGADYGLAHGTDNGCGVVQVSGVPQVADPYSQLASNIPANALSSCSNSFPQEPTKHSDPALPSGNKWSGTGWPSGVHSLPGNVYVMCGDVQMTGNVTLTKAPLGPCSSWRTANSIPMAIRCKLPAARA